MTAQQKWESLSEIQKQEELARCEKSMAYFYNNYIRKDGMPEITDEQIEEIRMQALMPLKRRRPDVRTYPLINKEAFQKGACPSSRHALEE